MSKPSFICLCPYAIYPPTHGGLVFIWNKLQALLPFYDIHLVTPDFAQRTSEPDVVNARMAEICTTHHVYRSDFWSMRKGIGRALRLHYLRYFAALPYIIETEKAAHLNVLLESLAQQYRPDFVLFEHGYTALLARDLHKDGVSLFGQLPWVSVEHNVESQIYLDATRDARQPWEKRFVWWLQYKRMMSAEDLFSPLIALRLYISDQDKHHFDAMNWPGQARVVTPIVRPLALRKSDFRSSQRIIFFGNGGYFPNQEGLLWFVGHVWPQVLHECPAARLLVAATLPAWLRKRLAVVQGVELHELAGGQDLDKLIIGCDAFISPIRLGSGIKIKNLIAMNLAMPMVATSSSLAGLQVTQGQEVLRADNAADFARAVVELLNSQQLREELSNAIFRVFNEKYSLGIAAQTWLKAFASLAKSA